jgi:hypothetical protein
MTNETETSTDHEAFLRLFCRFKGNLRAFVASLVPTWDGVDEVMQKTSIVLGRRTDQLDPKGEVL